MVTGGGPIETTTSMVEPCLAVDRLGLGAADGRALAEDEPGPHAGAVGMAGGVDHEVVRADRLVGLGQGLAHQLREPDGWG